MKGGKIADWPSKTFNGGKAEMLKGFINSSSLLIQFGKDKGERFQEEKLVYKNLKGDQFENTIEEILFHLVNHGTYHRGQIITLLRGSGVSQAISTDLIVWAREREKD